MSRKCARCATEISEGKHVVVWNLPNVCFICPSCASVLETAGAVKDITGEMGNPKE